jgi:hypothetical protein
MPVQSTRGFDGQSGTGTSLSASTSVFPRHYHSSIEAAYLRFSHSVVIDKIIKLNT